jgi:hypothetical protein
MGMLEQLAGCSDGATCDGIFRDGDKVLVRGQAVTVLERADGEQVVEIPAAMLAEAARRL